MASSNGDSESLALTASPFTDGNAPGMSSDPLIKPRDNTYHRIADKPGSSIADDDASSVTYSLNGGARSKSEYVKDCLRQQNDLQRQKNKLKQQEELAIIEQEERQAKRAAIERDAASKELELQEMDLEVEVRAARAAFSTKGSESSRSRKSRKERYDKSISSRPNSADGRKMIVDGAAAASAGGAPQYPRTR